MQRHTVVDQVFNVIQLIEKKRNAQYWHACVHSLVHPAYATVTDKQFYVRMLCKQQPMVLKFVNEYV